jgi:hypothetical protein
MKNAMKKDNAVQSEVIAVAQTRTQRIGEWLQDPLGGVVAASAATIGAFGFVLSGTWLIHVAMN